ERPALAATVADRAGHEREEQYRPELERADHSEPERRVRQLEHEPGLADTLHPGADQRDELAGDEQPEVAVGEGPEGPGDAGHQCTVTLCFCGMFYDVSSVPATPGS